MGNDIHNMCDLGQKLCDMEKMPQIRKAHYRIRDRQVNWFEKIIGPYTGVKEPKVL